MFAYFPQMSVDRSKSIEMYEASPMLWYATASTRRHLLTPLVRWVFNIWTEFKRSARSSNPARYKCRVRLSIQSFHWLGVHSSASVWHRRVHSATVGFPKIVLHRLPTVIDSISRRSTSLSQSPAILIRKDIDSINRRCSPIGVAARLARYARQHITFR